MSDVSPRWTTEELSLWEQAAREDGERTMRGTAEYWRERENELQQKLIQVEADLAENRFKKHLMTIAFVITFIAAVWLADFWLKHPGA